MKAKIKALLFISLALGVAAIIILPIQHQLTQESAEESNEQVAQVKKYVDNRSNDETNLAQESNTDDVKVSLDLAELTSVPTVRKQHSISSRNKVFTDLEGQETTLGLEGDPVIMGIYPSPSDLYYLVYEGSSKSWKIFEKNGDFVQVLPSMSEIEYELDEFASIRWSWRYDNALIAVVEEYKPQDPSVPQYPDQDAIPNNVCLYQYEIESNDLMRLRIPESHVSGLLRLEGVSKEGDLIVSFAADSAEYWGPRNNEDLRAYATPEQP